MDGIEIKGIILFLTEIPNRKQLAFCFQDARTMGLYPIAYVPRAQKDRAIEYWNKMVK